MFVPLMDRDPELKPNVAMMLGEALDVTPYKRTAFSPGGFHKTFLATKTAQGLLLCVRHPDRTAEAFRRTGILRKLRRADHLILRPREEDLKRFRRAHHVAAFSIAYGTLVVAERVWHFLRG